MQAYSNPKRAEDPYALPDVEVWYIGKRTLRQCPLCYDEQDQEMHEHTESHLGWYWQSCFPGCLPDSEPNGPFATEAEALADAQANADPLED